MFSQGDLNDIFLAFHEKASGLVTRRPQDGTKPKKGGGEAKFLQRKALLITNSSH